MERGFIESLALRRANAKNLDKGLLLGKYKGFAAVCLLMFCLFHSAVSECYILPLCTSIKTCMICENLSNSKALFISKALLSRILT